MKDIVAEGLSERDRRSLTRELTKAQRRMDALKAKLLQRRWLVWDPREHKELSVLPKDLPAGVHFYVRTLPKEIPAGAVLVHNQVLRPTRRLGSRGFRAWLESPDQEHREVCGCGWAPELGTHFRLKRAWRP